MGWELPSVRECLRARRLDLALAAILAQVAGVIIPFFGFRNWNRFPGIRTQPVKFFLENRSFAHNNWGARCYFVAWE